MKVVITGGAGFLGRKLTEELLSGDRGGPLAPGNIEQIVLVDLVPAPDAILADPRIAGSVGDLTDPGFLPAVVGGADDVCVFHLASMVSAECEQDFDAAMRVNLGGTTNLLEACRATGTRPRFVFASSIVAFGGRAADEVVSDTTVRTPETTYGMTKAVCELLVSEYTRKGFVDGRSARLATVVIRPGRPNAAASGWVSGIAREPLSGIPTVVPVARDLSIPVAGYRTTVRNLVRFAATEPDALGIDRTCSFPSIDVTPELIVDALGRIAEVPAELISYRLDPALQEFFESWAHHAAYDRATDLGLEADAGYDEVLREFLADERPTPA